MKVFLRIGLFLLILLIGISVLAFYWTFYKPLPNYSATIQLEGLHQPVDIHWDPYGVPHIYAQDEHDLYYAVGYVHAQDRLWQMTLAQIAAEGRFAEFLGEDLIDYDKYQRTLGFWETAKKIEAEAPDKIQQVLQAYSDGVNAYVAKNRNQLPFEFTLLDMEPIPWEPVYSYALGRLIAWDMNVSWWAELTYSYLGSTLPESTMRELFPTYHSRYPTTMTDEQTAALSASLFPMIDTEQSLRALTQRQGSGVGSNAWAVDGSRTRTGFPLLAGDPHMGLDMPGRWYEIHLNLKGKDISGSTLAGAPIPVLGQNMNFAWSMTNIMSDDTDFFLEQVNRQDTTQYVADSSNSEAIYSDFEFRDEVIKVRNGDDEVFRVRSTKHGPIISDIYPNEDLINDKLISFRWTGHEISHELWSLYRINWAESIDQFEEALKDFKSPGQNFTYADRSGNIALFSAVQLPIRDYNPLLFRHGWDPSYDWQDWIPFENLPRVVNPESGWVGNSNNKLHTDAYPYYIATFWESPSRIERVDEYMAIYDTLDVELFQQLQMDSYSHHAREVMDTVIPVLRRTDNDFDFNQILPYLENWDYQFDINSTAASLHDVFFIHLTKNTLLDDLGEAAFENFVRLENVPVRVMARLLRNNSFLFNNTQTDQVEEREDIIRISMQEAVEWLTEHYGEESFQWRWGNLHTIRLRPSLFAEASDAPDASLPLRMIVNNLMSRGPFPVPGHGMSVNKGEYRWADPYEMVLGASTRRIIDLNSLNRIYTVTPTGQSGNVLSDYFGDQTELWLNGQYRYLYQDSTFFREVSYQTMQLQPAN